MANTDIRVLFLFDEGPTLETLDYTIRIGSAPTFLYFDLHTYCRKIAGDLDYNFVMNILIEI